MYMAPVKDDLEAMEALVMNQARGALNELRAAQDMVLRRMLGTGEELRGMARTMNTVTRTGA